MTTQARGAFPSGPTDCCTEADALKIVSLRNEQQDRVD